MRGSVWGYRCVVNASLMNARRRVGFLWIFLTKKYLPAGLEDLADSFGNFRQNTAHGVKTGCDSRHGIVGMNFVFQVDKTLVFCGD